MRSVLGCQCVVIKQRITQTNARNRTKIRHRTKVILIAVAALGMYKYANWSGNGLPVSLVQQVGQEKFSSGDPEPEEETSAGLPNNRLMASWPLRGGCWWDSKEMQSEMRELESVESRCASLTRNWLYLLKSSIKTYMASNFR